MNDLDLIRGFRARVRDPDPERVQAAWANILPRLGGQAAPPSNRLVRTRRRWIVLSGVAAGVVALAIALPTILPGGSPGGAGSAEAARVLRRIAVVAADQPAQPGPAVGQYVYTKSRDAQTSLYVPGNGQANFSFTLPATRETWIGPDGSGRIVASSGEVRFPSAQDRAAWVAAGSPDLGGEAAGDERFGPGEMRFLDLSSLPTDPEELQALIEEREIVGGPPGDWETFALVGDLLRETYAPPSLRAALYEVAANLPGVEYLGRVKDAAGRTGLAVASTHDGIRREMIFDPETAQLLGERES
jgi:RNA polymerase sigma-70 factor (ECF subfamily)